MDEELTLEQINDMSVTLEHQKEVISLQKDIISLLRELKNKSNLVGRAEMQMAAGRGSSLSNLQGGI